MKIFVDEVGLHSVVQKPIKDKPYPKEGPDAWYDFLKRMGLTLLDSRLLYTPYQKESYFRGELFDFKKDKWPVTD